MRADKVVWMADETIENTRPEEWNKALGLAQQLASEITPSDLPYEVVDPIACWDALVKQLKGQDFSTIIDLSGFFAPSLRLLFPDAAVVDDFSISRLFEITPDGTDSIGHITTMTPDQIRRRKETLDLRRTLLIDDTTFSGTSNEMVMRMWGLTPEATEHASLLMNRGILTTDEGEEIVGAQQYLQDKGARIYFGQEIITPDNNGFHLKDLYRHPQIEEAFRILIAKQEGYTPDELALLFPYRIPTEDVQRMQQEGRVFVSSNISEGRSYTRNPLMWSTPYLREHVDLPRIQGESATVMQTLRQLYDLTANPQGKNEAKLGLREHTLELLQNTAPEGNSHGKESI